MTDTREALRLIEWARFNLTKGKLEAVETLLAKAVRELAVPSSEPKQAFEAGTGMFKFDSNADSTSVGALENTTQTNLPSAERVEATAKIVARCLKNGDDSPYEIAEAVLVIPADRYHGLPDVYPFNEPGFIESQAEAAKWREYVGPTENTTHVQLEPGAKLELWPGGAIFNEWGTLIGWLKPTLPPEPTT